MRLFGQAAIAAANKKIHDKNAEVARVLRLPRRPVVDCNRYRGLDGKLHYKPETQALIEVVTERFAIKRLPKKDGTPSCSCALLGYPCIKELLPEQAWALRELMLVGGVLGFLPVGLGKTIVSLLAPLALPNVRMAVLLAKSDQRAHYRKWWNIIRNHFRVPSFVMDDGGDRMIVDGAPILYYIPYSKLSSPESTKLLADLNPDLVVSDEVHCLANATSARTIRWLRFMNSRQGLHFAGWSGTLLDKSIRSMAHISAHALGHGSPLPINPDEVEAWALVLDPSNQPDRESPTAREIYNAFGGSEADLMSPLALALGTHLKRTRDGFKKRLSETPGVITSRSVSSTASILIHERPVKMPQAVREALKMVRGWKRPDEEEIVQATDKARCASEVGAGFYYLWKFFDEPEELIREWFAKRQSFNRELRERILRGEEYLDSRLLCENAAERAYQNPPYTGPLPVWPAQYWLPWREIKDKVRHTQDVFWIDDFIVKDAAAWAREHRGIIWTLSKCLGQKIAQEAGISYHGGGPHAERDILAETGDKSIVASLSAHSEGRDTLQFKFSEQLIVEAPSGAKRWGQCLGRLARKGQKADSVDTWVYVHFSEARDAIKTALDQAHFVEEMTPSTSLLSAADFTFEL